jgi:hypothetical protein
VRRSVLESENAVLLRNFQNTCEAEVRKVKMQCRKQALMRNREDVAEAAREAERQEKLLKKSDGLNNVSANLVGGKFGDQKVEIDWVSSII